MGGTGGGLSTKACLGTQTSPLVCGVAGGRAIPNPLTANAFSPMTSLLAFFKAGVPGFETGGGGKEHLAFLFGVLLLGEGTAGGGIGELAGLAFLGGLALGGLAAGGDAALEAGSSLIGETDLRSKTTEKQQEPERERERRERERERERDRGNQRQREREKRQRARDRERESEQI